MFWRNLSIAFSAGALGGLVNGLAVWLAGYVGLTRLLGVTLAPALAAAFLYNRLVWGGLFGLQLALLPRPRSWAVRGLLVSVLPSLGQLFVVFPFHVGKGIMGLELGALTPVFVIIFNVVWGLVAAWWYTAAAGQAGKSA